MFPARARRRCCSASSRPAVCICEGAEAPAALISADFFGSEDHVGFDRFAAAVSRAFDDVLGVPPENVFIRFGDIGVWSAGCAAFDIARLR